MNQLKRRNDTNESFKENAAKGQNQNNTRHCYISLEENSPNAIYFCSAYLFSPHLSSLSLLISLAGAT